MAWVIEIRYRDRIGEGTFQVKRPLLWDVMPPDRRDAWVGVELGRRSGGARLVSWRETKR